MSRVFERARTGSTFLDPGDLVISAGCEAPKIARHGFLLFLKIKKNPEADPASAPRASKKSNTNVSSRGEAGGRGHLFYFFKKIKKKWGISVALPKILKNAEIQAKFNEDAGLNTKEH